MLLPVLNRNVDKNMHIKTFIFPNYGGPQNGGNLKSEVMDKNGKQIQIQRSKYTQNREKNFQIPQKKFFCWTVL